MEAGPFGQHCCVLKTKTLVAISFSTQEDEKFYPSDQGKTLQKVLLRKSLKEKATKTAWACKREFHVT